MARSITPVWARIVQHEGEVFQQKRGGEFTYEVSGDYLKLDRTNHKVSKRHIVEALDLVPMVGPGQINHLRAPSYIWGILMDDRIRAGNW